MKKNIYSICFNKKLNYKYHDLYCVLNIIEKQVYCLEFMKIIEKIHFVFYVLSLKFYHNEVFNITSSVLSLKVNDIEKYEIEAVLNS